MVGRALIRSARALGLVVVVSLLVPLGARGQDRVRLVLPECAPSRIDLALLRELLEIELGRTAASAIDLSLGSAPCEVDHTALDLSVQDGESAAEAHDPIVLTLDDDLDPRAAARAIALAVAERVARSRTVERAPVVEAEPVTPAPALPDAPRESASALPSPLAASEPSELAPALPPATPSPALAEPLRLPPTLGLSLRGRIAPVLPSWALGLRVDLGASLDAMWSIRGELFATWTRATPSEGDVDAIVAAGAGFFGASVLRDASFDLIVGARAEAGVLVAMGWTAGASTGAPTLHPWLTAGAELDLVARLVRDVALVFDLALSGVIYGTRVLTWPSGAQIDLSLMTVDLGAGVRFAI